MNRWIGFAAGVGLMLAPGMAAAATPLDIEMDVPMKGAPQQVVFIEHDFTKGESSGLHIHHGVEMSYVLKGTMRVSVTGKAPIVVHAGDSFRVEREVPHKAVNIGDGDAALIITYVVDKGPPLKEPWPLKP